MPALDDIETFGAIDAESDELLSRCFEAHPGFKQALESNRFLVVGRKGSGKTAIYKRVLALQREDSRFFSVGHSFSDYPWHYHDAQVIPEAAEQERYLHSWRYLIAMSLAKVLLNYDNSQPWCEGAVEPLGRLEAFVVDTYGSRDPDITEVFHPGKRLKHLKSLKIDLKFVGVDVGSDELSMDRLPRVFQDVNKSLQRLVLDTLNPQNRYFVCFDQLDLGFQPDSRAYQQRLIGLILAARDFCNAAREADRSLKVLVFLRSDIYNKNLLFEDKNKITDTYKIELEWDLPGETTLKALMNRRFAEVLSSNSRWETVFDEASEMRGHQTKYQHILDRTFRRPRDIIKFCNAILGAYKLRRRDGGDSRQFINEDVNLAHKDYSNYLRDEIIDEIHKYHPEHGIYFEILKAIGYQQFTREDFAKAFSEWRGRFPEATSMESVLESLYDFSIIGFYRAGGSGYGGAEYVYKYLDQRAEFNPSADKFRVHWGLVDAFNLKQYRVS